ncbi:MAG TPA: hypothetical protein DEA08_21695 [Planctomycetes bacterium]|nr:hypothetical protein [Planctomycetota bacterium]
MLRASLVSLALLLAAGPALAQPVPKEPSAPPPADALDAAGLATLLGEAQQRKVLQHRLFTKRYYKAVNPRGDLALVTGEGSQTSEGKLIFKLSFVSYDGREQKGSLTYTYDAKGRLEGLTLEEGRKDRVAQMKITIADGKASQQRIRDGQPSGNPRQGPWTGDRVSLFAALVLVPSLGDLGLGDEVVVAAEEEDDDIGKGRGRKPNYLTVRREKAGEAGQLVVIEEQRRGRPVADVLLGTGKDKGVIKRFRIDPKPDGRSDVSFELIDAAEAQRIQQDAPLLSNEAGAARALRSVSYAQQSYQQKNKRFAETIEQLGEAKVLYPSTLAEGTSTGYLIMVRANADGSTWAALAVPEEPGKSGRYFYVIDKEGQLHRSQKEIQLDDSCKLPEGLEKVGKR